MPALSLVRKGDVLDALLRAFARHLRSENRSPRTVEAYIESVKRLGEFLEEQRRPQDPAHIQREDLEGFLEQQLQRWKPSTAMLRFASLQQFFKWLVAEGHVETNPMAPMRKPKVVQQSPPVLRKDQLQKLLAVVDKDHSFAGRRDAALLRLLIDTGARRLEIANIKISSDADENDLDLDDQEVVRVTGKGGRQRLVSLSKKTLRSLDRYLILRARHPHADLSWLWLGHKGRLTPNGIRLMVERRGRQAGIAGLHPHLFRHAMASHFLEDGGTEVDLMKKGGWRTLAMLTRYGAAAAERRALKASRRLSLVDQL